MDYRLGGTLGTTIYQGEKYDGQQPVAMVFNLRSDEARHLASFIVHLLNMRPLDHPVRRQPESHISLAERERCAAIAESFRQTGPDLLSAMHGVGWNEAVQAIAAAIRKSTPSENLAAIDAILEEGRDE